MKKKPKFEKLQISSLRRGEMQFDTAYNAPEAARIATRRAKKGWSVKVASGSVGSYGGSKRASHPFMTCEPSAVQKPYDPPLTKKVHAVCEMTPAFKKRVQRR